MAFKLTKKESDRRAELVAGLNNKATEIENAIDAYNETLDEAKTFVSEIHDRLQSEYDDKGDNWQEKSTKAAGADELINEWDNFDSEELEIPAPDHAENLENLPEEASE